MAVRIRPFSTSVDTRVKLWLGGCVISGYSACNGLIASLCKVGSGETNYSNSHDEKYLFLYLVSMLVKAKSIVQCHSEVFETF